jgi:hypothetical protein
MLLCAVKHVHLDVKVRHDGKSTIAFAAFA